MTSTLNFAWKSTAISKWVSLAMVELNSQCYILHFVPAVQNSGLSLKTAPLKACCNSLTWRVSYWDVKVQVGLQLVHFRNWMTSFWSAPVQGDVPPVKISTYSLSRKSPCLKTSTTPSVWSSGNMAGDSGKVKILASWIDVYCGSENATLSTCIMNILHLCFFFLEFILSGFHLFTDTVVVFIIFTKYTFPKTQNFNWENDWSNIKIIFFINLSIFYFSLFGFNYIILLLVTYILHYW